MTPNPAVIASLPFVVVTCISPWCTPSASAQDKTPELASPPDSRGAWDAIAAGFGEPRDSAGSSDFLPFRLQPEDPAKQPPAAPTQTGAEPKPGSKTNEANNPLTPKITINFHDYYVPSFYELDDRQANQFLLRGVIPNKLFGAPQLFRFTLPIAEAPTFPDGTDSGFGDLTLIDWFPFKTGGVEFGLGPLLVLPTASTDALGAGKWQAGVSGLAIAPQEWGILGALVDFQQSFAGDSDRDEVTLITFQPLVILNLPEGFYLRSTAIWNFDLNNGTYYIPAGFGAGKVWEISDKTTMNVFVEPQYTVFHDGVAPHWQIFAGLNLQFAF